MSVVVTPSSLSTPLQQRIQSLECSTSRTRSLGGIALLLVYVLVFRGSCSCSHASLGTFLSDGEREQGLYDVLLAEVAVVGRALTQLEQHAWDTHATHGTP